MWQLFACVFLLLGSGCESCQHEPAIVIRFEPIDAAGQSPRLDLIAPSKPRDLGSVAATTKVPTICKKDAECIVEPIGCCECSAMGTQRAVHKADRQTEADRFKQCGETQMCPQAMSEDASCKQKAVCLKGRCALK